MRVAEIGSDQKWRLGSRPALDGVRGVAIILVMLGHAGVPGFHSGGVTGVTLFFVLSGFLITSLLMEEWQDHGRINLRAFYRRRALRLLPGLSALVTVAVVYEVVLRGNVAYIGSAIAAVLYISNWLRTNGTDFWPLGHTWSLAIEEQFYLLWPAILLLVRRRRLLFTLALVGAAASMAEKLLLWHGEGSTDRVYYATDTRADALLLGCALALWLTAGKRIRCGWPVAVVAIALFIPSTQANVPFSRFVVAPILAAIGGLLMIAYLVTGGRGRILHWWPLRQTGRISYGLYLWNVPVVGVVYPHGFEDVPLVVRATVLFGLTYALALASYRWIELPYLRKKRAPVPITKESPLPVPVGSPAPAA